jgi:hypothetical protein
MLTLVQKIVAVVVALVVLGVAAVLIWYFTTHKSTPGPPKPPGPGDLPWKCDTTTKQCVQCTKDEKCPKQSQPDCQAKCTPAPPTLPWKCDLANKKCVQCTKDEGCPKQNSGVCNANCPPPQEDKSWDCIGTHCKGYPDEATGKYKTINACMQDDKCKLDSKCWLKTAQSLTITPSSVADSMTLADINKVLTQKDADGNPLIYGQDMIVQCSTDQSADPTDQWSKQFCNGKQLSVCQYNPDCDGTTKPCAKCQPFFSATGSQLQLDLQADKTLQDRTKRKFVNLTAEDTGTDCAPPNKYYRGVCLSDATVQRWTQENRPYGMAFYHGGKTGLPEFDATCAASYLKQIADFSNEKNINRVFLSIDSPLPTKQNPYFLQPQYIVKHFLANLNANSILKGASQPMEVGIIVYASPVDSSWNFQSKTAPTDILNTCKAQWAADTTSTLFPIHTDDMCFSNNYAQSLLGGVIDTPNEKDTTCTDFQNFKELGTQAVCAANCETTTCADKIKANQIACTDVSDCDDFVGKNCMPYASQGTTSCTNGVCALDCTGNCATCAEAALCCQPGKPCYCPNIASQVVAYVKTVNDAVDTLVNKGIVPKTCPKITHIAYDGEDAKADKDPGGQCQFSAMVKQLTDDKITVQNIPTKLGWAYSMNATPFEQVDEQEQEDGTSSFVMPEMYWFMGVNWPCMGSSQEYTQTTNMDENVAPCTSQIAYRDALVQGLSPTQFYKWVTKIQPCMTGITGAGYQGNFKSMRDNMVANPGQVWPMYSSESLSNQDEAATKDTWCLARAFNAGGNTQPKICGTADMLYSWSWDQIMELYDVTYQDMYMNKFGNYDGGDISTTGNTVPYLALYEAQFINPKWMEAKTFDSTLLGACQGKCEDNLVKCKTTGAGGVSTECPAFLKNNATLCTGYSGHCKAGLGETDVCHFTPPSSSTSSSSTSSSMWQQEKQWGDGPDCGAVCKDPKGGKCKCRYPNDQGTCNTCTKDSDCGTNTGNPIKCVPPDASKCGGSHSACTDPGGCKCKYTNDKGECPTCKTSTDCGKTTTGDPIDCVAIVDSKCPALCTDVTKCKCKFADAKGVCNMCASAEVCGVDSAGQAIDCVAIVNSQC